MALLDDARLVSRVLNREPGALEEFISQYRPFVYSILTRHLRLARDDADDLYQTFLVHMLSADMRRLRRWSGRFPLSSYLGRIVRNLAEDRRREQARVVLPELEDVVVNVLLDVERRDIVGRALRQVSARDRELLRRRYYLDQSYAEIAEAMQITPTNVGVSLIRAERRLRKKLRRLL
jgi:RNA polymerase sigma factor (sigma-70 family)